MIAHLRSKDWWRLRLNADTLRAGALASVVALIVWMFAEAQSLTESTLEARVEIVADEDRTIQVLTEGWGAAVTLRLDGPRSAMDAVADQLSRGVSLSMSSAGVPRRAGMHTVNLASILQQNAPLQGSGVRIVAIEPESISLSVDTIVRRENVPVRLELQGVELEREAEISPQVVTLEMPGRVAEALGDSPYVVVAPSPTDLRLAEEGSRYSFRTQIALPPPVEGVSGVRITPPVAQVAMVVRRRVESITVPFAPVWVLLPPNEIERWQVTVPPEDLGIQDLSITGPSDLIEQIRDGRLQVIAVVQLTDVELEARIESKAVAFPLLPDELRVTAEDTTVRLVIERRTPQGE